MCSRHARRFWRRRADPSPPCIAVEQRSTVIQRPEYNINVSRRVGNWKCGTYSRVILNAVGKEPAEVRFDSINPVGAYGRCGLALGLVGRINDSGIDVRTA